jgi:type IV pilus assembly protein PilC
MDAQQAFLKHQHMMGKFTAYMLGIASRSGNMAEIYESTARFLERQNEFKKSVRSAMITPAITIAVLIAAFVWYIWYIFPETARLFEGMNVELPSMTQKTLAFADWMDANYGWVLLGMVIIGVAWTMFAKSDKGRFWIHRNLIRIPLVGSLFHKLNIEIFCRVFAILYSGAGDNIGVIKIAAEGTGNSYMEHRIKTITVPMMVAQGTEAFLHCATQAPQPMHEAASIAMSAVPLPIGIEFASGAAPVRTLMNPPDWTILSKALRLTTRSRITGNGFARNGSTRISSPSLKLRI